MKPGGYLWWYVDALSDDHSHGFTLIAFVGSVFSPYYHWAGRRDPENHVAINVALYGRPGARWAMTERGRGALKRDAATFRVGPSGLAWDGEALRIDLHERSAPFFRPIRGAAVVRPRALTRRAFVLDEAARHRWAPLAPQCDFELTLDSPNLSWTGQAYLDTNDGDEPLEDGFESWDWARAIGPDGVKILYETRRRAGGPMDLALQVAPDGLVSEFTPPPRRALPKGRIWGVPRAIRADDGAPAQVAETLEDTPFYTRNVVETRVGGAPTTW
ncbi:MAG: hypothetical protein AAF684_09030, partial [Pseudomonadota bacterium]